MFFQAVAASVAAEIIGNHGENVDRGEIQKGIFNST
jgi:hypothetical protein